MTAKIYQPSASAMQSAPRLSGKKNINWVLEFEEGGQFIEPLMGWTGSHNMTQQLKLSFDTADEAIHYAEKHNIPYEVWSRQEKVVTPKSYASNFK